MLMIYCLVFVGVVMYRRMVTKAKGLSDTDVIFL